MPPQRTSSVRSPKFIISAGRQAPWLRPQAVVTERAPDPGDRRAQLIQLTPSGRAASDRIREAGTSGMQAALAHWPRQELHQLATLLHRMVDDFLAYSAEEEREQPVR